MPVFDPDTLARLAVDTDSRPFALGLARSFRELLGPRVERLRGALADGDLDDAMDAVLSLKVSSCMTGAVELCDLARGVEADLRRRDLTAARTGACRLPGAAEQLDAALSDYLARA